MPVYKYKNSHGDLLYYIKVSYDGKQYTKRGFKTKSEARTAELNFIDYIENKLSSDVSLKTMDEVLDSYLIYFKQHFKPTSYDSKFRRLIHYLYGKFSKSYLKVTYEDFNKLLIKIAKTVSYARAERILSDIKSVYEYALRFLDLNNKDILKLDKIKNHSAIKVNSVEVVSYENFNKFIHCFTTEDYNFKVLFQLAYFTGLRHGEILGLLVKNIDFKNKVIHVVQQVQYIACEHTFVTLDPKSSSSVRDVFLTDFLVELLKNYIEINSLKDNHFCSIQRKEIDI